MILQKRKKILLLFGGKSGEHEVSCISAASILRKIDREKYDVSTVGITKEGAFMYTEAAIDEISSGKWVCNKENLDISVDLFSRPGRFMKSDGTCIETDCVFPMLHGTYGEDGCIQGMLEVMGIPYVGTKVLGSAAAMDKVISKKVMDLPDIKQAKYMVIRSKQYFSDKDAILDVIEKKFNTKYPLFVKPANTGSSVGISKAHDRLELENSINEASNIDNKIIIEETIVGRELEVAVMGNYEPVAAEVGEIIPAKEFYDYEAKYDNVGSVTRIPKDLSKEELARIKCSAVEIYKLFDCKGLSRVDFFYTSDKDLYFIEVNTLPGFTNISMYPKLWAEAGVGYKDLIDRLIELAMEE